MKKREKNTKKNVIIFIIIAFICIWLPFSCITLIPLVREAVVETGIALYGTLYVLGLGTLWCSCFAIIAVTALKLFD